MKPIRNNNDVVNESDINKNDNLWMRDEEIFKIPDAFKINKDDNDENMIENNTITNSNNNGLYTFKVEELLELEKYLKSKIYGQDEVVDKLISSFLLYTHRNEKMANIDNLGIYFSIGKSGVGKNFLASSIAEKLGFSYYEINCSNYSTSEFTSLLGATDGYSTNSESIMENIYDIYNSNINSDSNSGKMMPIVLLFDEIEKIRVEGREVNQSPLNAFFTAIMGIISSPVIYTKNSNRKIELKNFIFIFNTNLGLDTFDNEIDTKKIGFNVSTNSTKVDIRAEVTDESIEKYFKNNAKINISVYNRIRKGDNFMIFNELGKSDLQNYIKKRFNDLKCEISENFGIEKLPNLNYFKEKINNYDYSKGFRGIDNLVFLDFKLYIYKNIVYKSYFNKTKQKTLSK